MNQYVINLFFWAFISMFMLVGACTVVGTKKIGSHSAIGWAMVTILFIGRIMLSLMFVEQPRLFFGDLNKIIGLPLFIIGVFFALGPCTFIKPLNIAEEVCHRVSEGNLEIFQV
jgi:hypothetical protein